MNTKDHLSITPSVALLSTTGRRFCGSGHCFYVRPSLLLGEGNGNPLQYSCLGNPMDREASQVPVTKSQTRLNVNARYALIQTCTVLPRKALFMRKAFFMKTEPFLRTDPFLPKMKGPETPSMDKIVQSRRTKTIFQIVSSLQILQICLVGAGVGDSPRREEMRVLCQWGSRLQGEEKQDRDESSSYSRGWR